MTPSDVRKELRVPLPTTTTGMTVVVVGSTAAPLQRTAARATAAGRPVVVGWLGPGPAPPVAGAPVRTCFPLGASYAVNRCLAEVCTERVVVVLPGRASSPFDFELDQLLAVGGLDHALPLLPALTAAAASFGGSRPLGRVARAATRRVADRVEGRPSPRPALRLLPPELGLAAADLEPLPASVRSKSHLLYRAPQDRVLHLYADPSPRLQRGVADREQVRQRSPEARVPALHAAVPGRDSLWVLEDEVVGRPLEPDTARWWDEAALWLVALAGPPGPPLQQSADWSRVVSECCDVVPAPARADAARALEAVGRRPSRHQHGDLQPRNVVRTPSGLAAIDWEGVWAHGVPGLDVLFLALLAHPGAPARELLCTLAAGGDSATTPVRPALQRLGVHGDDVAVLVRACLAVWTRGESSRGARLGVLAPPGPRPPVFGSMWAALPPLGTPGTDEV